VRSVQCALGNFNVKNLMGIKRVLKDTGKIRFLLLVNVLKMFRFLCISMHLKFAKNTNITQHFFLTQIFQYGYKKTKIFMLMGGFLVP
jgi:hypothetical protein